MILFLGVRGGVIVFDILLPENGHGPLYMQLYRHIRGLIQRGVVKDGTKIPSIRSLRQQLHISKTTIETAYQMLLEEGYVVSKPRSGLFVVNPQSIQPSTLDIEDAHNVEDIHLLRSNHTPHSLHHGVIDFNLLAVDGDSFPIQSWKSVLIETIAKSGSSIHQYGDPKGEYALRMSLAQ
jgi:GntR family transcriptional regulator/MocR family aminotransferase